MSPRPAHRGGLRVVHVLTSAQHRGAELFARDLDRALRTRHVDSRAVALRPAPSGGPALDIDVLDPSGRSTMRQILQLRRALTDVDVVVAHGSRTLAVTAVASLGTRAAFVYRVIGEPSHWSAGAARRWRVRALLARARAVVTYTDDTAEAVSSHLGVPRARVHVIAKGIELAAHPAPSAATRAAAREQLGLDGTILLALGALSPEKNLALAIDAAALIPGATLALVGSGPDRASLEARAAQRGLSLLVPGAVVDPRPWLLAADVVLLTSRTEGVPGVLLEAAASATPAVAVDVGGVTGALVDGVTGRLVPRHDAADLADAIGDVLARREQLSASARTWAEEHADIAPVAAAWQRLLETLAPRSGT